MLTERGLSVTGVESSFSHTDAHRERSSTDGDRITQRGRTLTDSGVSSTGVDTEIEV